MEHICKCGHSVEDHMGVMGNHILQEAAQALYESMAEFLFDVVASGALEHSPSGKDLQSRAQTILKRGDFGTLLQPSGDCVECEHKRITGRNPMPHSHNNQGHVVYDK